MWVPSSFQGYRTAPALDRRGCPCGCPLRPNGIESPPVSALPRSSTRRAKEGTRKGFPYVSQGLPPTGTFTLATSFATAPVLTLTGALESGFSYPDSGGTGMSPFLLSCFQSVEAIQPDFSGELLQGHPSRTEKTTVPRARERSRCSRDFHHGLLGFDLFGQPDFHQRLVGNISFMGRNLDLFK